MPPAEALLIQALRGIDPVSRQCIYSATMQTLMDIRKATPKRINEKPG